MGSVVGIIKIGPTVATQSDLPLKLTIRECLPKQRCGSVVPLVMFFPHNVLRLLTKESGCILGGG